MPRTELFLVRGCLCGCCEQGITPRPPLSGVPMQQTVSNHEPPVDRGRKEMHPRIVGNIGIRDDGQKSDTSGTRASPTCSTEYYVLRTSSASGSPALPHRQPTGESAACLPSLLHENRPPHSCSATPLQTHHAAQRSLSLHLPSHHTTRYTTLLRTPHLAHHPIPSGLLSLGRPGLAGLTDFATPERIDSVSSLHLNPRPRPSAFVPSTERSSLPSALPSRGSEPLAPPFRWTLFISSRTRTLATPSGTTLGAVTGPLLRNR